MFDMACDEDMYRFFNINLEKEPLQKFTLHDRLEVSAFDAMLNKHVKTESHLSFNSLNLVMAYDYCMTLGDIGAKLFAAFWDLKITIAFLFIDGINSAPDFNSLNRKDGANILEDEALFNKKVKMLHYNIDLAIRYRAFYDKFMGLLVLMLNPSRYEEYISARSRKKVFPKIVKDFMDDESILSLIEYITFLDENYRTSEVHQTGSMRTWVLTSRDLFIDKQLNLMNYFNAVLGHADWVDEFVLSKLKAKQ